MPKCQNASWILVAGVVRHNPGMFFDNLELTPPPVEDSVDTLNRDLRDIDRLVGFLFVENPGCQGSSTVKPPQMLPGI